jgi:transposase
LTDAEWTSFAPLIPAHKPIGRPRKTCLFDVFDASLLL